MLSNSTLVISLNCKSRTIMHTKFLLIFLLFPGLLLGGPKTFSLGNIKSIGSDSSWDAMENPANLSAIEKTHSIVAGAGISFATFTDNSIGMKDKQIYKDLNYSQMQGSIAYAYKGFISNFRAAIAIGSFDNSDTFNNSYTEFKSTGTYTNNSNLSKSAKTYYDTGFTQRGLSISPAASYSLLEQYHFGLSLKNYIGSSVNVLNLNDKSNSEFIFDQYSSTSNSFYHFSPTLGFIYKKKEDKGEVGIKYTPFTVFINEKTTEKAVQYFDSDKAFTDAKAYKFNENKLTPGNISLGISDELMEKILFFVEGRVIIPNNYQYQRIEFINNGSSITLERQIVEYKNDSNIGLSIGVSASLIEKMNFSIGFSYDKIIAIETLKDSTNKSYLTFEETITTGKKYLLTMGYSYKLLKDMELVANLGFYQNLYNIDKANQITENSEIEHYKTLNRYDGFTFQLAYLQNL